MGWKGALQANHFKNRIKERFGIAINRKDRKQIINLIRQGKSKPIERRSNRVCVHEIEWNGKKMNVVYDNLRGQLVTALYPEGSE